MSGGVRWLICLAAVMSVSVSGMATGMAAQTAAVVRVENVRIGAEPVAVEVAAGAPVVYALVVPTDTRADFRVRQDAGSVMVTWTDADGRAHEARGNGAGVHAVVRLSGLGPGEHRFYIADKSKTVGARVELSATVDGRERGQVESLAAAEESLGHAELLRGRRDAGEKTAALAAYDAAIANAAKGGSDVALCSALTLKALYLLTVASDAQGAAPLVAQATGLAGVEDGVERASAWKVAGYIDVSLGRYEEGMADYERALALFGAEGDVFNQAVLLQNRSNARRLMGDFYGALADAQRALPLVAELKDASRESGIEESLGSIYYQQGDLQHAYQAYRAGLEASSGLPTLMIRGYLWSDLGQVYSDLGDREAALQSLGEAEAVWKATPTLVGQLSTLDGYGTVLRADGKLEEAVARYGQGLELARKAGLKREMAGLLLGLARTYLAMRKPKEALAAVEEGIGLVREIHEADSYADFLLTLGDCRLQAGEAAGDQAGGEEAAVASFTEALKEATERGNLAASIGAFGELARVEELRGNLVEAERYAMASIALIESARERLTEDTLRSSYFASKRAYYDFAIRLLMGAWRRTGDVGYARRAFLMAERGRARRLLDELTSTSMEGIAGASPEQARRHRALMGELREEQKRLATQMMQGHAAGVRTQQARVVAVSRRLDDLEGELRAAVGGPGSGSGLGSGEPEFSVEGLQRGLGTKDLALEYWVSEGQSYLWVIGRESFRGMVLPGEMVLRRRVEGYLKAAKAPLEGGSDSAAELAKALAKADLEIESAGSVLRRAILPAGALGTAVGRLVVVPDGLLFDVPFAALPVGVGGGLVVDRSAVVEEPSLRIYAARRALGGLGRVNRLRVAVVADPVYSRGDARVAGLRPATVGVGAGEGGVGLLGRDSAGGAWPRLEASEGEARGIGRVVGEERARLMLGLDATPEALREVLSGSGAGELGGYSIVHVAAHTEVNREHPELSGILLSTVDRQGRVRDGVLWYSEIAQMRLRVQLVVLSSCESAHGRQLPGEGLVGLGYAFQVAGTPRVLGTLWKVDDRAMVELTRRFYQELLTDGGSVDEALRRAQAGMRREAQWKSPYYWAGVVFAGDPSRVSVH